jgi:hypothetical protein
MAPHNFNDIIPDEDRDYIGRVLGDVYLFWPTVNLKYGWIRRLAPGTDGQWLREVNYGRTA